MISFRVRSSLRVTALALIGLVPTSAYAQGDETYAEEEGNACIEAYERVQTLRASGQLTDAREAAIVCAGDSCPNVLATECAQWLDQIAQSMPSVVLAATSPDGQDLVDVDVTVDGRAFASELGARAVSIDPGPHKFVFTSEEHGTVELKVIIREGEKNRSVQVQFDPPEENPMEGAPPPPPEMTRPIPASAWVLGGVGIVGIGVGTVFEIIGLGKQSDLDECKPNCAAEDVDSMRTSYVVGDVSLAVGIVSLAAGALVYFTRPEVPAPKETATLPVPIVSPLPGGGFAGVSGSF